jgi:hypothetical protein
MTPIVEAKAKRRFCRYSNLYPEVPGAAPRDSVFCEL